MNIISLAIENIKKIKAVRIMPTNSVITIQGENGVGKSSVLDSIVYALKGGREIPEKPIRDGEKKALIEMDMGEFKIIRSFTQKSSSLKIEPKEALKGQTPQNFLDGLLGKISFDPLAFINQEGKKQKKVLAELTGIDVDRLDKQEKELYDDRAYKNKEYNNAKLKVENATVISNPPQKEVSIVGLTEELTKGIEFNQKIEDRESENERLKEKGMDIENNTIPECEQKIQSLKEELRNEELRLEKLNDGLRNMRSQYKIERAAISELEFINTDLIQEQIANAEKINKDYQAYQSYLKLKNELNNAELTYKESETKLTKFRENRIKALQEANMPIEGLDFGEDGLTYKGIPLEQCSDGEKLMIGMGISMALNPTIRVLRIKDGSLLGPKNLKILEDMVRDKDYQLWIERVSDEDMYKNSGGVGILITEGEIQYIDGQEVESKNVFSGKAISCDTRRDPTIFTFNIEPNEPVNFASSNSDQSIVSKNTKPDLSEIEDEKW